MGKGMNSEPGTNGKPAPLPNGHNESILISNDVAYVGSDNGSLYALDTSNGIVRWNYKVGSAVSLYAIDSGVIYATGDTALYALNAESGKLLWQYRGSKWISQVIVANGAVYTATAADNNASMLVALRVADGKQLWDYTVAATTPALMGVVDGIVYAAESSMGSYGSSVENE